ncbi:MAG: Arm DNA-binding domain-containing protein, partial [Muribaculaceae bacterium]|nr:Arm DNA-binding domain-containing protein [Muribaculaceae bacterium]
MTSIKVKFRPSTSEGREGKIYFQIIHERVVRQWYSDYKIFSDEWDGKKSSIIISTDSDRRTYLQSIRERIKWDKERFNRIVSEFSTKENYTADEIIEEFGIRQNQQSFF